MELLAAGSTWIDQIYDSLGLSATAIAILQIIGINIILSGDNAVVIALACRSLPPRQRAIGIILGAGAAVVLRIIFTVLLQQLLGIDWVKLVGGVILFWIAVKLILSEETQEDDVKSGSSVWEAVKIVAIADIVMSLDNVLAIASAAEKTGDGLITLGLLGFAVTMQLKSALVILGLAISIPLVVFGSTMLLWLLDRLPVLVWAGAALLGYVAGELIVTEPILQPALADLSAALGVTTKTLARIFEFGGAALVVAIGWLLIKANERREARNGVTGDRPAE